MEEVLGRGVMMRMLRWERLGVGWVLRVKRVGIAKVEPPPWRGGVGQLRWVKGGKGGLRRGWPRKGLGFGKSWR